MKTLRKSSIQMLTIKRLTTTSLNAAAMWVMMQLMEPKAEAMMVA
jgi:hypothetical protein